MDVGEMFRWKRGCSEAERKEERKVMARGIKKMEKRVLDLAMWLGLGEVIKSANTYEKRVLGMR